MFNRLPAILLLIGTATATAQVQEKEYEAFVSGLLEAQTAQAARTTAIKQRVVAQSVYFLSGGPFTGISDSLRYTYSGGRGSRFSYQDMGYYYDYAPFASTAYYYTGTAYSDPGVHCDSVYVYMAYPSGVLSEFSRGHRTYHNSTSILQSTNHYPSGSPANDERYNNSYDAQGRMVVTQYSRNTTQWNTYAEKYYQYDVSGRLVHDSFATNGSGGPLAPAMLCDLSYGTNGKVAQVHFKTINGGNWQDHLRYEITYDPSGRLHRVVTTEYPFTGGANVTSTDSFAYAGTNPIFKERYLQFGQNLHRYSRHFNAQDLPDTVWLESFDQGNGIWKLLNRKVFTYNSKDNPVKCVDTSIIDATLQHRFYYYEEYDDIQDVETISTAGLKIYPNPATEVVHLEWKGAPRYASVGITDVTGRKVFSSEQTWNGQMMQINTGTWANGVYVLTLTGGRGEILHVQSLMKK